ncbi:MAG: UbiD family decarboxylase, partial [Sulfurovaceae bacterium]|nr:UbiD family decarboxylase [Sulfurovaceae bacterium]
TEYILNRLDPAKILITQGIIDALDHTANESLVGGKLGIDATGKEIENGVEDLIDDKTLLQKFQNIDSNIVEFKQYFTHTKNPITVITINKTSSVMNNIEKFYPLKKHIKVLVVVDKKNNDINDPYMLIWRVVNNIDASRDVILNPFIIIDGTNKSEVDGFNREWPNDTFCTKEVLDNLQERGLIDIDDDFIKRFGLLPFD